MFYQDWDVYYPGIENWHQVPAPGYHYQYHHHHRPRRKYGPYLVPSDPFLLQSGPSDYFFAGSNPAQHHRNVNHTVHRVNQFHSGGHPPMQRQRTSSNLG